jgi:hypothetical protein
MFGRILFGIKILVGIMHAMKMVIRKTVFQHLHQPDILLQIFLPSLKQNSNGSFLANGLLMNYGKYTWQETKY